MKAVRWMFVCASSALSACAGNGDGLDENGRPADGGGDVLQATFDSIQANVLTPVCTTCHSGAAAPLGLRLDEGASYALLVNAPSIEVPALNRVQPGDPDASYLVQKLEGTATVGGRMPLNQPPLPPATIAIIRQWIADGAQADATMASAKPSAATVSLDAVVPLPNERVHTLGEIVLSANALLDLALLQSGVVTLRASGLDGSFEEGNEQAIPLSIAVRSAAPTVLALTPLPGSLVDDAYELRISGGPPVAMADAGGELIDGDGDGAPGGDFVLQFTVESAR